MRPLALLAVVLAWSPLGIRPGRREGPRATTSSSSRRPPKPASARSSTSSASGATPTTWLICSIGRSIPRRFPPAVRLKALEVLADLGLEPEGHPVRRPHGPGEAVRGPVGAGRAAGRVPARRGLEGAGDRAGPGEHRQRPGGRTTRRDRRALDALAAIGGPEARARRSRASPLPAGRLRVRTAAIAALARVDVEGAARLAPGVLADDARDRGSVTPLIAAFLDRQGGAEKLADALDRENPTRPTGPGWPSARPTPWAGRTRPSSPP